jgi:Na+/melibiose symporter-like transporter
MVYGVFATFISFWLTDMLKIRAGHAGAVISVGGIFDTIGVVIVGFIVQNTNF